MYKRLAVVFSFLSLASCGDVNGQHHAYKTKSFQALVKNVRLQSELIKQGKSNTDKVSVEVPAFLFDPPIEIVDVRTINKSFGPEIDFLVAYTKANIEGSKSDVLSYWHASAKGGVRQMLENDELFKKNQVYMTKNPGLVVVGLVKHKNSISVLQGKRAVKDVVQKYGGKNWYARFVKEPFRTFIRASVQHYTSRDIKGNREVIADQIKSKLMEHIQATPFQLVSLVVGNVDYPPVVSNAVEQKLAAQQLLEEKTVQKEIAQRDAEIKIEEAKGIAEAQRIINETLTTNYLQHEAIMAQTKMASSPNHTTVYIPVGANGIPVVYTPK